MRVRRRARAALPAAQDVRGRDHRGRARRARRRARERDPRGARDVAGRGASAPLGAGEARRARGLRRARAARRAAGAEVGGVQRRAARADPRGRGARGGDHRRERSGRAHRGGEADLAPRTRARARRRERPCDGAWSACAQRGSSACSAQSATTCRAPRTSRGIRRLSPLESTYTKERSVEVCMDTLARLGFDLENEPNVRLDLEDRPQKSPRACVIASDPPRGRPPDHPGAGRTPRLPGVPARGRPRAALRGLSIRRWTTRSARSRATTR